MLNNDMKLPQMKHIMEINGAMKPVLNMVKNGDYTGNKIEMMQTIDDLQGSYENDYVFKNSDIFSKLDYLAQEMQINAQNGIVSNIEEKKYSEMVELGESLLKEYNTIIEKYQK